MIDQKTVSVYDSQVDNYLDVINDQPEDKLLLDFISLFNLNDLVLDLGCGPATASATMHEHGLRVDPVDASMEMVKIANQTFNIGARQASFEEMDTDNSYDGVWANFSLLHARQDEFPSILKLLHRALKRSGVLHLGMKIGEGSARDKLGRFYSYYSEEELRSYLGNAGFTVEHVELGEGLGLAGELEPWIAVRSTAN